MNVDERRRSIPLLDFLSKLQRETSSTGLDVRSQNYRRIIPFWEKRQRTSLKPHQSGEILFDESGVR